jgi:hypothetical protein
VLVIVTSLSILTSTCGEDAIHGASDGRQADVAAAEQEAR